jgi:hypothetical protein
MKHDIRKLPKEGCEKCGKRLLLIKMLSLLLQHGGRPIVAGCCRGTGLLDAYVDLIAHVEKWEERGEKGAKFLADITYDDPMIRSLIEWGIGGALGQIGFQGPVTSVEGLFGMPEVPDKENFKKIYKPAESKTVKYRDQIQSYMTDLKTAEDNIFPRASLGQL